MVQCEKGQTKSDTTQGASPEVEIVYKFSFFLLFSMVVLHFLTKKAKMNHIWVNKQDILQKPLYWTVFVDLPSNKIFPGKSGFASSVCTVLYCVGYNWSINPEGSSYLILSLEMIRWQRTPGDPQTPLPAGGRERPRGKQKSQVLQTLLLWIVMWKRGCRYNRW